MSPEDLAKIIASSDCGSAGLKIRIDTCNSAADLGQAKLNVAQKVCLCLANMYKMKGVTVEGTVDSSITGFAGTRSRQVHGKDSDIESIEQAANTILKHRGLSAMLMFLTILTALLQVEVTPLPVQVAALRREID